MNSSRSKFDEGLKDGPFHTQDGMPSQLTNVPRWVCWRADLREGKKIPVNPNTGASASVLDCRTWSDFATAKQAQHQFSCDGVGIVLTGDGLVAIDLDNCVSWRSERWFTVEPWALTIVQRLNSYTEFSPSCAGLHVFVFGSLP